MGVGITREEFEEALVYQYNEGYTQAMLDIINGVIETDEGGCDLRPDQASALDKYIELLEKKQTEKSKVEYKRISK